MLEQVGFLVPPWYERQDPGWDEMNSASLILGFSHGLAVFGAAKAVYQTRRCWKSSHRLGVYIAMIWGEWLANVTMSILSWLNLWAIIPSSFWLWFAIVVLWCFQVQVLMQIIINRVSLLIHVKEHATRLKWGVFLLLLVVNITVFIVWIPAMLQISPHWIQANQIWDRIEKCIFLLVDASLNFLFVHLVRARFIESGLTKYKRLFYANIAMVMVSIALDVVLIGLMSLPIRTLYLQFQCLSYLGKLYIEMNMADLIRKVVKATHEFEYLQDITGGKAIPLSELSNNMSSACRMHFDQLNREIMLSRSDASIKNNNRGHSVRAEATPEASGSASGRTSMPPPSSGIHMTVVTRIDSEYEPPLEAGSGPVTGL
ncbi:hypothetical protein BX600DRAFT_206671 [Xylariales sp. PMI_506]|nr:hypothetical protein BX600DRAFT_206671 [Xylariales sp. PMI_506]